MKHYQVNNIGKVYMVRNDLEKIGDYTLRVHRFNENALQQGMSRGIYHNINL